MQNGLPSYEPRGCQRGISFSWYLYSPLRVKYPYIRGALLDLWKQARARHADPVDAWKSLVENPKARQRWQRAQGKGGFRRLDWDTALEIMAAANVHTIKAHGPDRIAGFSPIPAMSMISYAAGARMLQLMGGVSLSFYDWYCDLPPASPEVWGEQTDVHESANWYNAKLLAVAGSNLNMTRTPDCHFTAEAQPIAFSHRLHAGELQMACVYCHTGAETSRHAGVPAASTGQYGSGDAGCPRTTQRRTGEVWLSATETPRPPTNSARCRRAAAWN